MTIAPIKKDIWRGSQLTKGATLARTTATRIFRVDAAASDFVPPVTDTDDAYKKACIDAVLLTGGVDAPGHPQYAIPILTATCERLAPTVGIVTVRYGAGSSGHFNAAGAIGFIRSATEQQMVFRSTHDSVTPANDPKFHPVTGLPDGDVLGVPPHNPPASFQAGPEGGEKPDPQPWDRPIAAIAVRMTLIADPTTFVMPVIKTTNAVANPILGLIGSGANPPVFVAGFANAQPGQIRFDGFDTKVIALDATGTLKVYDTVYRFSRVARGGWYGQQAFYEHLPANPLLDNGEWKTEHFELWPKAWIGTNFPTAQTFP